MTTLEGVIVNRYPIRRTMTAFGTLRNWVWCEKCLDWKDTDEVSFISIEEDKFSKDVLHFLCDECELENKNNIIQSVTKPRNQ